MSVFKYTLIDKLTNVRTYD